MQAEVLSTHDAIARRLRELKEAETLDISKMSVFEHKSTGLTLRVGALGYNRHQEWMTTRNFEDLKYSEALKINPDALKNRSMSDILLLAFAVYTDDGQPLGSDLAKELLSIPGTGPDTHALLAKAEETNPPREQLSTEVSRMLSKSAVDCLIWKILFEAGLLQVLIDYMATSSTPEEYERAKSQLTKISEVVYALEPLFGAKQLAESLEISFTDGVQLLATFGNADAVMEARKKALAEAGNEPG